MHAAGYMHGDLKLGNILFEDFDDDGCPRGLQLADLGISRELGKAARKFDSDYYYDCWHLPGALFRDVEDPLELSEGLNNKHKGRRVFLSKKI